MRPSLKLRLLLLCYSLGAGNLVWQLFTDRNWAVAFERSFFQAFALFMAWRLLRKSEAPHA